jgi:Aspartyl protease
MLRCGVLAARVLVVCASTILVATSALATGVPFGGYLPMVGIGLSNQFDADILALSPHYHEFTPTNSMMLGYGNPVTPHFDLALLDTGAGFSLLTDQAFNDFNIDGPYSVPGDDPGFAGTKKLLIGGATGTLEIGVNDPLGLYASGLQNRNPGPAYSMNLSLMSGQTNTSIGQLDDTSDLPNVLGLPFIGQYSTYIRNDQPQFVEVDGRTVRTPAISFLPLGDGGQGIIRKAPLELKPGTGFQQPPLYVFNQEEDWDPIDEPWENPTAPTILASTSGGAFLNVNASDNGGSLGVQHFLFDTGADVTVVSSLSANLLGYNGVPDFTVAVIGSGGTAFDVPGFFVDSLTVFASNDTQNQEPNNLVLNNVPVIILNVRDPSNSASIVPGIIGTNIVSGRNVVFDPNGLSGRDPGLYIGDPVTTQKNWTTTAATGMFSTNGNWSGNAAPDQLGIANVRWVAGASQTAVVSANARVWEVNVSGDATHTMKLQVNSGVTLQTFSGINIELGGAIEMQNATIDTQYVEMLSGTLSGTGTIETGSGPIPGQVENRGGTVAPGVASMNNGIGELEIYGRFSNGPNGTVNMQLGGDLPGQYDQIVVDGSMTLAGTLNVSLVNSFVPSVNDTFVLFDITASNFEFGGAFSVENLPAGYQWDLEYTENQVLLTVLSAGLAGDFNEDGVVDGADYVMWRKQNGPALDYTDWVENFGSPQSGGGGGGLGGVPEPSAAVLMLLAICGCALSRKR